MHSCLLVGGAPTEHKGLDLVLKNFMFDAIIAVDAGYAALVERGIAPHHAFGDFDAVGDVGELLRLKLADVAEKIVFEYVAVQAGHAVDRHSPGDA